ncbi:4Fe-4S dicluster domain-containing protein [Adlercreutzia sp. R25]|uniref:4Fe-4S dicluster domain-containing protein n=1 Tax=Adlercreutzia shanghongiae TaxID=3111773 RepID=A0ABU6J0H9_9ACTN|nr:MULTISPECIES: 4Fe-4S dicluster domain-containing protein [unclassified Adlercreutzia]MEC4273159.1 4Fe-4S dicluster domain-containing protein [Adlercreutzia sp. R25]MEC4295357.1 4Fe-4S dicluster domain-containing protein [Adlercreutzia sp. R22]
MTNYGMAIDLKRCFGCQTCAAACKTANNLPKDIAYNVVYTKNNGDYSNFGTAVVRGARANDNAGGAFPDCVLSYLPVQCQHCANPACVEVCPTGASAKDPDTGIVSIDDELCIGCESCIQACPYEGVRTPISDDVDYYLDVVLGEHDAPVHEVGSVEKCTFCKNLIDRGEKPACMVLCPGRARYWGDLDDPESEVSKAIAGRESFFLREEAGTSPSVFYLK